jgi:hypothetical protein
MLALKFTPYQADSLVGVQMHFVPTVNDQTTKTFLLTVWDDAGGVPGNVLYQDEYYLPSSPIYEFGYNQYHNYYFKDMQKIYVGGTFYVGWRQLDDGKLGIGFDRNTDSQTKTFITPNQGTPWINSSISGTVMIRPVISSKMDYQLGFKEQNLPVAEASLKIFPNPVSNEFQLEADFKIGKVELYAIDGSKVKEWETNHTSFQLDGLMNGLYIVRIYNEYQNCLSTQKLIKE